MHYSLEQGWPFSWTLKGLLHMAVLMPRYSPTLLTYFLFPSMAPSGNYFDTTETSSPAIMLALAQVGSPMGEGQGPPSLPQQSFRLAGRHKGTRVQACLGHLGHRGTSPGDLGDSRSSPERQPWRFWVTPPKIQKGAGNIVTSF